jgi:hypothetical protein
MARPTVSLGQAVLRFYLKAPLAEIEQIQPSLAEIYNHRKGLATKSALGRKAAVAGTGTGKSGNGRRKKGKKAAADTGFGGKEIVGEAAVA